MALVALLELSIIAVMLFALEWSTPGFLPVVCSAPESVAECASGPVAATMVLLAALFLLVLHSRPIALTEGLLEEIVVEYREGEGNALVALYWSSDRLAEEILPPSLLFPGSSAVKGSPWPVNVTL